MATADYQLREALKLLARNESVDRADFSMKRLGDKTIAMLLHEGLATESRSLIGRTLYSITDAGRARLTEPTPPKLPQRKLLSTLPPRLPSLDPMDRFRKK